MARLPRSSPPEAVSLDPVFYPFPVKPLRDTLAVRAYLAGDTPNYADHAVFGAFQWARVVSPIDLVPDDDPITIWVGHMLEAYGRLARLAPRAQVFFSGHAS